MAKQLEVLRLHALKSIAKKCRSNAYKFVEMRDNQYGGLVGKIMGKSGKDFTVKLWRNRVVIETATDSYSFEEKPRSPYSKTIISQLFEDVLNGKPTDEETVEMETLCELIKEFHE